MQVITNKIHQNTLIKGIRIFFPENSTDFVFQKLPEEIQSKIVYFYSVINEYSLRSRDMTLHAILLTKNDQILKTPMMLSDRSTHTN